MPFLTPLVQPAAQATLEPAAVQLILGQRTERLLTVTLAYSAEQHKVHPADVSPCFSGGESLFLWGRLSAVMLCYSALQYKAHLGFVRGVSGMSFSRVERVTRGVQANVNRDPAAYRNT